MIHSRDQCEKTFPNKSDPIEHARIHSGVKQYKCDQCDETFSQNSSFNCTHKDTLWRGTI